MRSAVRYWIPESFVDWRSSLRFTRFTVLIEDVEFGPRVMRRWDDRTGAVRDALDIWRLSYRNCASAASETEGARGSVPNVMEHASWALG